MSLSLREAGRHAQQWRLTSALGSAGWLAPLDGPNLGVGVGELASSASWPTYGLLILLLLWSLFKKVSH